VLTIGQVMEKLAEGDAALLAVSGYGQSALTATKKKLRALGFELPEAPVKVEETKEAEASAEAAE
jgi:large subunit ribosomal protein L31